MKGIFIFFICLLVGCQGEANYVNVSGFAQGTTYSVTYQENGSKNVAVAIDKLLSDFDACLSNYNDNSLLSRVNRHETNIVDEWFNSCFVASLDVYNVSGGLFDPSLRPLINAYGFGSKGQKEFKNLNQEQLDSTLQYVGLSKISITDNKIELPKGMSLDFSAIAQGYSADLIAQLLDNLKISNYIVEIGGEVYAKGVNRSGDAWRVGIDSPKEGNFIAGADIQEVVELTNQGLATSGNYRKYFEVDGKKYSHSINPKNGLCSKDSLLSVTIIAKNATMADGYSTSCMVGGYAWSLEFIKKNNLKAYLIYENHKKEMITTKL